MRVCLMIEGQEDVTWDQWRALALIAEEHGFETLFRSDHYLSVEGRTERGSLDAWSTLAGLAAITSRIRLGTLVSPATFRHPLYSFASDFRMWWELNLGKLKFREHQ